MIDLHSHILPGIDDGSKSLEESLEMARIAQSEGIKKIINTSHYHPEFEYKMGKSLLSEVQKFNKILKENNIDIKYPSPVLCTDNAAMIGCAGYYSYINGRRDDMSLNAVPNLRIGQK